MTDHAPTIPVAIAVATIDTTGFLRPTAGVVMTALMIAPRIVTIRRAPKRDHQWPFVSLQLRLSPPTAFVFSIMIAGAYRLIATPMKRAMMPPTTKRARAPQMTASAELGSSVAPPKAR